MGIDFKVMFMAAGEFGEHVRRQVIAIERSAAGLVQGPDGAGDGPAEMTVKQGSGFGHFFLQPDQEASVRYSLGGLDVTRAGRGLEGLLAEEVVARAQFPSPPGGRPRDR